MRIVIYPFELSNSILFISSKFFVIFLPSNLGGAGKEVLNISYLDFSINKSVSKTTKFSLKISFQNKDMKINVKVTKALGSPDLQTHVLCFSEQEECG